MYSSQNGSHCKANSRALPARLPWPCQTEVWPGGATIREKLWGTMNNSERGGLARWGWLFETNCGEPVKISHICAVTNFEYIWIQSPLSCILNGIMVTYSCLTESASEPWFGILSVFIMVFFWSSVTGTSGCCIVVPSLASLSSLSPRAQFLYFKVCRNEVAV